jgi:hypothetical protein
LERLKTLEGKWIKEYNYTIKKSSQKFINCSFSKLISKSLFCFSFI